MLVIAEGMSIVSLLVTTIGFSLFLGWVAERTLQKRNAGRIAGAAFGIALSVLPWQQWLAGPPHPSLTIEVPADFKHELVIFLTDPNVDTEIQWDESKNRARIKAPKSGVIRLKSLGRLDNQLTYAHLSNGKTNWGLTNTDVHGARLVAYEFNYDSRTEQDLGLMSENEVAELIRKREAE